MSRRLSLVEVARLFDGMHERADVENRGLRVESVQHWSGGTFGDSWCMEMLWLWLDLYSGFTVETLVPRMQLCEDFRQLAQARGWVVTEAAPGDVCVSIDPATGRAHHIALVTETNPFTTIAGNTSKDGKSREGKWVAEHPVSTLNKMLVRIPI